MPILLVIAFLIHSPLSLAEDLDGSSCEVIIASSSEDGTGSTPETIDLASLKRLDTSQRAPIIDEIDKYLEENVIAQPEIRKDLVRALARLLVVSSGRGAGASLLINGPTGVGKTLSLERLAEFIEANLIEMEGGNYQVASTVTNLTGAAPTYVGHGKTVPAIHPKLIVDSRGSKVPVTIILINEADKAHLDFLDWWLTALDSGKNTVWMPVQQGDKSLNSSSEQVEVDLSRTIVVMTTNAGAEVISRESAKIKAHHEKENPDLFEAALGVGDLVESTPRDEAGFKDEILQAVRGVFTRPEFVARFDEITTAWPLLKPGYLKVVDLEIKKLRAHLEANANNINALGIKLTELAKQWLVSLVNEEFGARNLSKVVKRNLESLILSGIGSGQVSSGDTVIVHYEEGDSLELYIDSSQPVKPLVPDKVSEASAEGSTFQEASAESSSLAQSTSSEESSNWDIDSSEYDKLQQILIDLNSYFGSGLFDHEETSLFKLKAIAEFAINRDDEMTYSEAVYALRSIVAGANIHLPQNELRQIFRGNLEEPFTLRLLERYSNIRYGAGDSLPLDIDVIFLVLYQFRSSENWQAVDTLKAIDLKDTVMDKILETYPEYESQGVVAELKNLVDQLIFP